MSSKKVLRRLKNLQNKKLQNLKLDKPFDTQLRYLQELINDNTLSLVEYGTQKADRIEKAANQLFIQSTTFASDSIISLAKGLDLLTSPVAIKEVHRTLNRWMDDPILQLHLGGHSAIFFMSILLAFTSIFNNKTSEQILSDTAFAAFYLDMSITVLMLISCFAAGLKHAHPLQETTTMTHTAKQQEDHWDHKLAKHKYAPLMFMGILATTVFTIFSTKNEPGYYLLPSFMVFASLNSMRIAMNSEEANAEKLIKLLPTARPV